MKKFLALFLALLMVMSLAACGGDDTANDNSGSGTSTTTPADDGGAATTPPADTDTGADTTPDDTADEPAAPEVAAPEEITAEPLYYNGFESTDGLTAVHRGDKSATPEMTGANYSILPSVHEIMLLPGVDGNALAVDGKYGVKLENVPKTADDSYTIAFWYAADRYGEFMPILDIGHNTGLADAEGPAWIRFTRANTWSITGAECAPVVWDRNAAVDTWPWIGNNADERGKKEWIHVALVADGVEYQDSQGKPHVGATVYVNGIPVMAADASRINYTDAAGNTLSDDWMGLTTGILNDEGQFGIECYFGINYWDSMFKGYMDELYIYDEALTAGQIATLYTKFTAPEYEKFPDYTGPLDEEGEAPAEPEPVVLPEITPSADAVAVLGTTARDLGFWSQHTASYEIPADGTPVTFKLLNYSDATANYRNFYNVFCSIPMEANDVDPNTMEGYVEYGVIRADSWDFGTGNPDGAGTYERSWGDDWAGWLAQMADVDVTVTVTRTGPSVNLDYTYTCADGSTMTAKATVELPKMTDDLPCYGFIGGEGAYIELLSVE